MQTFDVAGSGNFQIEHQCFGATPGNGRGELFIVARQINGIKMLGETNRQSLRSSGVILVEDYIQWFHRSP